MPFGSMPDPELRVATGSWSRTDDEKGTLLIVLRQTSGQVEHPWDATFDQGEVNRFIEERYGLFPDGDWIETNDGDGRMVYLGAGPEFTGLTPQG